MKRACAENWENIVELAEGRENALARAHVESCPDCTKALQELTQMMRASSAGFFSAPASLIDAVIGLMPKPQKARAGLLRSTLGLAGARAATEDFQLVVAIGEEQSRIMYLREETGWEVIGKVPDGNWRIERESPVEIEEDGRFSFRAPNLKQTGFDLISPESAIEVPSAEELLLDGA